MARKPVYLPILTTAREKNDYFENLIEKINNNKFSSVRDNNLNKLESFVKFHKEFLNVKIFRKKTWIY